MASYLLIWLPLFLLELFFFIAACGADPMDLSPKQLRSSSGSATSSQIGAGHGRPIPALPDTPRPPRKAIFEPHLRRQEEDFIRNLSLKMTMKRKKGSEDIRFKVEVLLRDHVVMRSFFDMITEDENPLTTSQGEKS